MKLKVTYNNTLTSLHIENPWQQPHTKREILSTCQKHCIWYDISKTTINTTKLHRLALGIDQWISTSHMSNSGTDDWICATEKKRMFPYLLASSASLLAFIIYRWLLHTVHYCAFSKISQFLFFRVL